MSAPDLLSLIVRSGLLEKKAAGKLDRSAFVYMEPRPPADQFAECGTCINFTGARCLGLGKDFPVGKIDTCGVYVHGKPALDKAGQEQNLFTAKEVGFVKGKHARCENCVALLPDRRCKLYVTLNRDVPELFELEETVEPKACCNAMTPKGRG